MRLERVGGMLRADEIVRQMVGGLMALFADCVFMIGPATKGWRNDDDASVVYQGQLRPRSWRRGLLIQRGSVGHKSIFCRDTRTFRDANGLYASCSLKLPKGRTL